MATLTQMPNNFSFINDGIIVGLSTDKIDDATAYFNLEISASPTTGQTVKLEWPGSEVTFTVAATTAANGLSWPVQSGGTLAEYAELIVEFLRQYEPLTDDFDIRLLPPAGSNQVIRITRNQSGVCALVVTETLSGVAVTATSVTTITTPDNLAALVSVYTSDNVLLMKHHATYNEATGECELNISPSFTNSMAELPLAATIEPTTPTWQAGVAESHVQAYYFRYADRFGTPPVAEAMVKSDQLYAILGGTAKTSLYVAADDILRHNYITSQGSQFSKPVSPDQPDWLYFLPILETLDGDQYLLTVRIEWSDGTESLYNPFGTTQRTFIPNKINWVKSGFRQLFLHNIAPPSGTSPDALIDSYEVRLEQGLTLIGSVMYQVEHLPTAGTVFLLMENGVGGMESVWLHGAPTVNVEVTADKWRRATNNTASVGEIDVLFSESREVITVSTGYYSDLVYLNHLKQILHGACWLIDKQNKRFLRVIIENTQFGQIVEDDTVFQITVEIKSAWINTAFNV